MRFAPVFVVVLVLIAAGCGGGTNNTSGSAASPSSSGSLVTKVESPSVKVEGTKVVGTVKVTEGGKAGEHLTLRYGLVDAVSGVRASQEEELAAKYTTTKAVNTFGVTIRFAKPDAATDYLLHFVLYGPDGSYLASADTDVFTVH
jgi:hypothetical protein